MSKMEQLVDKAFVYTQNYYEAVVIVDEVLKNAERLKDNLHTPEYLNAYLLTSIRNRGLDYLREVNRDKTLIAADLGVSSGIVDQVWAGIRDGRLLQ